MNGIAEPSFDIHPSAHMPGSTARGRQIAEGVAGRRLAAEVEEYFQHGAHVEPGDVVVDVGANVGAFAAAVAGRTEGRVTIHCFEPAAPLFAKLQWNFAHCESLRATRHELHPLALTHAELHGTRRAFYFFTRFPTDSTYDLEPKMDEFVRYFLRVGESVQCALTPLGGPGRALGSSFRTLLTSFCRPDNPLWVWSAHRVTGLRALTCQLASLQRVLDDRDIDNVDLLKIDVEGAELDVLRGCDGAWPRIQRVAVETHDRGGRAAEVVALLENAGLVIKSCRPPKIARHGGAGQLIVLAERPSPARERGRHS